MSKYIKLEDAINGKCPVEDIWEDCINCPLDNNGIEPCKMGKWLKSLPTIEVGEGVIGQGSEDIDWQAVVSTGQEIYTKGYEDGRKSVEVSAISHYINGYKEATQRLERFYLEEAKRYTELRSKDERIDNDILDKMEMWKVQNHNKV